VLLGLLTIGAYGFTYYSFGVFLEPISADTGWSRGGLSGAFALGAVIGGGGGIAAGRVFDAYGPRPVWLTSLALATAFTLLASQASSLGAFTALWGVAAGAASAGLFYNVTMATTSRLYPGERAAAFTVLTFVGGLALPVFGPLSGFLIDEWGWRSSMRILACVQALLVLPAIVFVRTPAAVTAGEHGEPEGERDGYGSLSEALRSREVVQMTLMFAFSIAAFSAVQVHHVAAFRAAGVSLGAAATMAGVRGILSLPGRGALALVQGRLGTPGAIMAMYAAMAAGVLLLAAAGHIAFAWAFVVVTGLAFGTIVPLQGLYSAEVLGNRRLGTLLGAQAVVLTLAGAGGPLLAGAIADAADSYRPALLVMAGAHAVAIVLLVTRPRRGKSGPGTHGV
jgi:MFS family permease